MRFRPSTAHCLVPWFDRLRLPMLMAIAAIGTQVPLSAQALSSVTPEKRSTALAANPTALPPKFDPYSTAPVLTQDDYILGPGDRIKLDFFSVPEFSGEYTILPNGGINLPQVGLVSLQGYTPEQAVKVLVDRYDPILTRPVINLNIVGMRPMMVAITGEIERPGAYALTGGTGGATVGGAAGMTTEAPTLSRAIQLAEGLTRSANVQDIKIRRQRGRNVSDQIISVNLLHLLRSGDVRQDIKLRDGDSILIPTGGAIDPLLTKQLIATNLASRNTRPIQVAVVGQVRRPGPHLMSFSNVTNGNGNSANSGVGGAGTPLVPTITQAIQQAGGISELADIRNIEVRRLTRSGTQQNIKVNFLDLLKSGDLMQDIPLQEGDTVEIPTATEPLQDIGSATFSPDKMTISISGEVEKPGTLAMDNGTSLTQALLLAGGFNKDSVKKEVTLIRLKSNGTVEKRDIPIDFGSNVNDATNPALRHNDIIIVKKSGFAVFSEGLNGVLSPFTGIFSIFRLFGGR